MAAVNINNPCIEVTKIDTIKKDTAKQMSLLFLRNLVRGRLFTASTGRALNLSMWSQLK